MKSQEFPHPRDAITDPEGGMYEAEVVKVGFCPECGAVLLTLGDRDTDVAIAHISLPVLDTILADLQSIRQQLRN